MIELDIVGARRYILGKQGLWPGRRFVGLDGAEAAMRGCEHFQLDPLTMIARSQDIQLAARVIDYKPDDWQTLTYGQRKFFDWGGWLAARPMEELPYFRRLMLREAVDPAWKEWAHPRNAVIEEMRAVMRERETVTNRNFAMKDRTRNDGDYRGRKDSALGLYYLWRMGEVMTFKRERFERVYARAERVAPAHLLVPASEDATDRHMLLKEVAFYGLHNLRAYGVGRGNFIEKKMTTQLWSDWRERLLGETAIVPVKVEGWKHDMYARAEDATILTAIAAGRRPAAWTPLDTDSVQECSFLAPLDPVSGRSRADTLFDFRYRWEVYTKEHKREYGYYVLPVLWGDRLVARFDSKFDKTTKVFHILGLWLEDYALAKNADFAHALALGFQRFARFLGATKIDAKGVSQRTLKAEINLLARMP